MARKANIDLLRTISAAAVVILHTAVAPIGNCNSAVPFLTNRILTIVHSLTLWAVPVFFIITGYCLLLKPECDYKYCFRHILRFVAVLFTVGLFYALSEEVYSARTVNAAIVLNALRNVIAGRLWDHMWFIYAIIGIYLVMPVIHTFIRSERTGSFVLTGLLFVFNILLPTIESRIPIGVEFPFGGHLFYVCFGGLISKYGIQKRGRIIICIAGLISSVFVAVHYDGQTAKPVDLLAVCFISSAIFLIFSRLEITEKTFLLTLSKCTYGIYLFHPLFINIALKVLKIDFIFSAPYIKLPLLALVAFTLSFALTYLLKKLPLVSKLF